jgi:excisionase family DNA binding protein
MWQALLTEEEAAEYLRLTPRALQAWRYQGKGPRFVRISRRAIRYRRDDLEEFVEENLRHSTSDPGGNANAGK